MIIMGFLSIIPTFLDALTQNLGYRESNNILRVITGILGGIGLGIIIMAMMQRLVS